MIVLTPAERRAAVLLVALLVLGALMDLAGDRDRAPHEQPVPFSDAVAHVDTAGASRASIDSPPGLGGAASALVDLNHATAPELDALPGVGPVLAARILEQRRRLGSYRTAQDLRAVRGIGPRLFQRLEPLIRIGAADSVSAATPPADP